eukprot:1085255-Rhodomonas_salina.2
MALPGYSTSKSSTAGTTRVPVPGTDWRLNSYLAINRLPGHLLTFKRRLYHTVLIAILCVHRDIGAQPGVPGTRPVPGQCPDTISCLGSPPAIRTRGALGLGSRAAVWEAGAREVQRVDRADPTL